MEGLYTLADVINGERNILNGRIFKCEKCKECEHRMVFIDAVTGEIIWVTGVINSIKSTSIGYEITTNDFVYRLANVSNVVPTANVSYIPNTSARMVYNFIFDKPCSEMEFLDFVYGHNYVNTTNLRDYVVIADDNGSDYGRLWKLEVDPKSEEE